MNKTYEAMIVVDPTTASKNWNQITEAIEKILKRYGVDILSLKKWGERKLAYPIKKHQRGTYVLVYFTATPDAANKIRDDLKLSEVVLRSLILQCEGKPDIQEVPKDFETIGATNGKFE